MPPKSRWGIQPRILVLFFLLSTIPLLLGAWVFFSHSESCFLESKTRELAAIAENTVLQVRNHLQDLSRLVDTLSFNRAIRDAVSLSNEAGTPEELEQEAVLLQSTWQKIPDEDPRIEKVTRGELPDYLRRFVHRYGEVIEQIIILNSVGAVVAATERPRDYYHGGKGWYASVEERYLTNLEGTFSEIKYEKSIGGTPFKTEIAIPVFDPDRNKFIGMIKCILEIVDLNHIIRPFCFQQTGQSLITSGDGTIISSRDFDLTDQVSYEFFEAVKAVIENKNPLTPYFFVEKDGSPQRIVGLPRTSLRSFYPELEWYIFADQEFSEALGPVQGLKGTAIVYIGVMIILLLSMAFWLSKTLGKPPIETDLHLEKL